MLNKELELEDLKPLRNRNKQKIIIGHLNINSLRYKFESLSVILEKNIDIFLVSETKIDDAYPTNQFLIEGFSEPYRLDRTDNGGGLLLYVRLDIPSKSIKVETTYEGMFVEIRLNKEKWLICCSYNPHLNNIDSHLEKLQISIDSLSHKYENLILLGDLNCEIDNLSMPDFCKNLDLKGLINVPTCYKNPENPKCIDHILTNRSERFQKTAYTLVTGISDFHKMTIAILKKEFKKLPPKVIKYRCYRNFDEEAYHNYIKELFRNEELDFQSKLQTAVDELNRQAPLKTKTVRGNHAPFITKEFRKEVMIRSKLKNRYYKNRTEENKRLYNRQKNYCVSLLKRIKRAYFENLDDKQISDSRKFWKIVSPHFSNKGSAKSTFTLIEDDKIISEESKTAQLFNDYYSQIVSTLDLPTPPFVETVCDDHVQKCVTQYMNHPSIREIKNKDFAKTFSFKHTNKDQVEKVIKGLSTGKSQCQSDIPVKIVKKFPSIFAEFISKSINESIDNKIFPNVLKLASITPVYKKKGSKTDKGNYRPISILPVLSKVFERIMHDQISDFFEKIFSNQQCGYRKGHDTQNSLLNLTEAWKKATDDKNKFGALLIDLSKAFDCICHDLLIAKMESYGFHKDALDLISDYLRERKQRSKVGDHYSNLHTVNEGVPQGSILGPLLFNIYIRDLFYKLDNKKVVNYADDTTPFSANETWELVQHELNIASNTIFTWLSYNHMQGNADKAVLITNNGSEDLYLNIQNENIQNSKTAKILGVTFDNCLSFEEHITKLCNKASQRISAFARIASFLTLEKRLKIMNAFFKSQFSYCPLVWMFHTRKLEKRINHLHERCLRLVYQDNTSSFEELLQRNRAVTFHHKSLQLLATELFKNKNKLSEQLNDIFLCDPRGVSTRQESFFKSRSIRTVFNGEESLSYFGPKIWELLPTHLREEKDLKVFKKKIKHWRPTLCPCRNCRIYIDGVGFI